MKKIVLTTCSILALTALTTGGCTRTPKQGKTAETMSGWRYKHGFRHPIRTSDRCGTVCLPVKSRSHAAACTTFDKALNTRASTLTVKDYYFKDSRRR